MIRMLAVLVALLLALLAQSDSEHPNSAQLEKETAFKSTFSSLKAPLVVEVPFVWSNDNTIEVAQLPPNVKLPDKVTERALSCYAALIGKEMLRVEGAYVLSQPKDRILASYNRNGDWVAWLNSVGASELKALATSYTLFSNLDPYGQALITQGSQGSGLYQRIQEGKDVKVKVIKTLRAVYSDPKTGQECVLLLGGGAFEEVPWDETEGGATAQDVEIVGPEDGLLKYAEGKLTTYRGFVGDAAKAFGCRFVVDTRLDKFPLFVKGSFTKERFVSVYKQLYKGIAPRELPPANSPEETYQSLVKQLIDLGLENPEYNELLRKCLETPQQMTCQDLRRMFPNEFSSGSAQSLADKTVMRVTTMLYMRIYAPGMTETAKNMYVSNDTRVSIKPVKGR